MSLAFLAWQNGMDPKDRMRALWTQEQFYKDFGPLVEQYRKGEWPPMLIDPPVVLDLKGSGRIDTLNVNDGAYWDYYGNGFAHATGWVSPDAGILVMDLNGNGALDNGSELFGSRTPLPNGQVAADGFQALAALDSNHDGKIDAQDPAYSQLRVWANTSGDGNWQQGEVFTLPQLDIESIDLNWTTVNTTDAQGNIEMTAGSFQKTDGSTGLIADYGFHIEPFNTIPLEILPVPDDIAALPDLPGSGTVHNLQQAMVRDTSGQLEALVRQFAAESDTDARTALMDQILFKWTGSDTLDPAGRGGNIDARKLAVLEDFFGVQWSSTVTYDTDHNAPNPEAAVILDGIYHDISEAAYGMLMVQTHFKDLFGMIDYTVDTDTGQFTIDGDSVFAMFRELMGEVADDPIEGRELHAEFQRTLNGIGAVGGGITSGGGTGSGGGSGSGGGTGSDGGTGSGSQSYCDACPLPASPASLAPAARTDPLVLDLNGDSIQTTREGRSWSEGRAFFDLNADGFAERTGWVSGNDGLLVWDRNGDGFINDGRELFGSGTALAAGGAAATGFQALGDLDSNHDGLISSADAAFSQLRVWKDDDEDGFSFPTELYTLAELGMATINLTPTAPGSGTDAQGNTQERVGTFTWADGTSGQIAEYTFDRNTAYTIATEWVDVPDEIAALPDLPGYGTVPRLQQAMARDTSGALKGHVNAFAMGSTRAVRQTSIQNILYTWTGSSNIDAVKYAREGLSGPRVGVLSARAHEASYANAG
ncbi:MAG: hypothetical protein AB1646_20740 [Thermodesulfobacteriota bacterium]